jgi:acetyltransferase-like isoleucine patch superfamily enzyme
MVKIKLLLSYILGIYRKQMSKQISKRSFIANKVQFLGIHNIEIQDNCTIGENTTFTVNDRSDKEIRLKIGSNTYIGRNNFFSVGNYVNIGPYCIFGNNCSFVSSDHVFDTPLVPYALSGNSTQKGIKVGANCWIGINVPVVGDVEIGHGSIIGANALIVRDVPPFSIVVGNPARIIKRYDFRLEKWIVSDKVEECTYFDENIYIDFIEKEFKHFPLAYHSGSSQFGNL